MPDPKTDELLRLNARLLESIDQADWNTYQELCDPSLTAFEPESRGQLVEGLDFHRFYFFSGGATKGNRNTTLCAPQVRLMGDVAVVTYVRLSQFLGPDGVAYTAATEETRVWQRRNGTWKHVHFHRSSHRT
jgi:calcium/calmodulin-dependent protein kinase (CaM kinase) II